MIKKLLLGLGLFILVLLCVVSIALIQPHLLRGLIGSSAHRFAGLNVDIADIQSHINPLRFEISGLSIKNPEWPRPELLSLADITISLTQSPFSHTAFWELNANQLTVNVEQNESSELNWISSQFKGSQETPSANEPNEGPLLPGDFNFNQISIKDVTLNWRSKDDDQRQISLPELSAKRIEKGNGDFYISLDYLEQHVELNSAITLFDPQKGILGYELSLHHQDLDISSNGKLYLNPKLEGSTLSLSLDLRSANAIAKLAGTDIPPLPKTKFSSDIKISPNYELNNIVLKLNDNTINGDISINAENSAVTANLRSTALDIDSLLPPQQSTEDTTSSQNKIAAPSQNSSNQNSKDETEAEINWAWLEETNVNLELDIEKLTILGWQVSNLKSDITLHKSIQAAINASQIQEIAKKRDINEFSANVHLEPLSKTTTGADTKVSLTMTQAGITSEVSGKLNVNGIVGNELDVVADAPSSQAVWQLAQLPWQEAGSLSLQANLKTTQDSYTVKGNSQLGEQSTELDIQYTPAKTDAALPTLKGDIFLRKIDLAFLSPETDAKVDNTSPSQSSKKKLISKEPFALSPLKSINTALTLRLEDIDTGYNLIQKARLAPTLQDGLFNLKDTVINFDGGEAKVALKLDASKEIPELDIRFSIDADDYGKLGLDKAAGINKGSGRIRLDADSKGLSPHQLAANMTAKLDLKITDLVAQGNALNLIGSDVLTETIDKLNPFSEKKTSTTIECVAVHFKGSKGKFISDDAIALETKQTKIIGTGNIDIGNEEFLLGVSPIARTGVGINIGAAAGLVRLGGTFNKPKIVADPSGMFTSGLSTGAAFYTGGLSLLAQGLLKRAIYSGSACDGDIDEIPTVEELPDDILNPTPETAPTEQGTPTLKNEEAPEPTT